MTDNHVKETVDHVAQALDKAKDENDQTHALERLQDDVRKDTKGMNADQQKEYMTNLTKELEARNQLPVLSVVFAGQLGGDMAKSDINAEIRNADREQRKGDNTRILDKAMLKYLADNYDQGQNLVETRNENWGRTDSCISKGDITDKLAQFRQAKDEQHRVENNQSAAEKTARTLLDGGDQSLFNFLDRNSKDGRITKKELQDYLSDARSSGSDSGHFSKDKQQVVEQMLKDWDNREKGAWIRGGFAGDKYSGPDFTKQSLILAAGKKSESEITHKEKVDQTIDAKAGEGYWQLAQRNLAKDGKQHNDDEVRQEATRIGGLNGNKPVHAGDHVKVGEEYKPVADAKPNDSKPNPNDSKPNPNDSKPNPNDSKQQQAEVKQGDSYWRIAERLLGNKASLAEVNAKMKELQQKNDNKPIYFDSRHPSYIKI